MLDVNTKSTGLGRGRRFVGACRLFRLSDGERNTYRLCRRRGAADAPIGYRTKARLLGSVVRAAVLRDDGPEDVLEHGWVKDVLRLPDVPARLAALARHTARTVELTSHIHAVIADAGSGDSELDELRAQLRQMRFDGQARIIAAIADGQALRPGLTVQDAVDTFSALASPELHRVLTGHRGWSQPQYARWLERTTKAAFLPD